VRTPGRSPGRSPPPSARRSCSSPVTNRSGTPPHRPGPPSHCPPIPGSGVATGTGSCRARAEPDPADDLLFDIAWEQVDEPEAGDDEQGTWAVVGGDAAGRPGDRVDRGWPQGGQTHARRRLAKPPRGSVERASRLPRCGGRARQRRSRRARRRQGGGRAGPPGRPACGSSPGAHPRPRKAAAAVWELAGYSPSKCPAGGAAWLDFPPGAADAAVRALMAQRSGRGDDQLRVGPGGPRARTAGQSSRPGPAARGARPGPMPPGDRRRGRPWPAVETLRRTRCQRILWAGGTGERDLAERREGGLLRGAGAGRRPRLLRPARRRHRGRHPGGDHRPRRHLTGTPVSRHLAEPANSPQRAEVAADRRAAARHRLPGGKSALATGRRPPRPAHPEGVAAATRRSAAGGSRTGLGVARPPPPPPPPPPEG